MNDYFQKALTTSRVYLVDNIDYDNLRDFLVQYKILPPSTLEDIDSLENRRKKIRKILDCLSRRDDNTFPRFLMSLFNSNQAHIASNLYQETLKLIDPTNSQLKEWLQNIIVGMLPPPSACLENKTTTELSWKPKPDNEPVENSLSPFRDTEPKPMESEEDYPYTNKESEHGTSFLSNEGIFASTTSSSSSSSSSSSQQQLHHDSVYHMDSNPRGLLCIINAKKGADLTGDAVPLFENKASPSAKKIENDAIKLDTELQQLFWGFGIHSCVIELENSTFHSDKLDSTVYKFSHDPPHYKYKSCMMALLGFSESDLNLTKLLSYFNEKNCSSLVGKPKLILIQLPNDKSSPSNLMSNVEIPEDSLVAVGIADTDTKPGMVSSLIQLCRQMNKSSYSVEEIFSQIQHNDLELKIAVKKSLRKPWILDFQCQPQS